MRPCPWRQGAPYVDRLKYAEQGQEKPGRGFHTSDFMRRDEFTMTFRTEQYRTLLKVSRPASRAHTDCACACPVAAARGLTEDTGGALQQEAKHAKQAAARAHGGAGGAAPAPPPPPPPPRREVLLYDLVRMQSGA